MAEKPPLGIMPRYIFLENRISELLEAIRRYLTTMCFNERDHALCIVWSEELKLRLVELSELKEGE